MEEDEEVIFRNTGLYDHLLNSGFDDFESVVEKEMASHGQSSMQDAAVPENIQPVEFNNDELDEFQSLLNMFLNSNLIFNDDVLLVKNFVACFNCDSPKKSLFRSQIFDVILKTAAVSTLSYVCSMCGLKIKRSVIICLHAVPVGLHFATYFYFKNCRNKRKKCTQTLLRNLKNLSLLIQKCIQFINESEIASYNDRIILNKTITSMSDTEEWRNLYYLRKTLFLTMRSNILNLKAVITRLLASFPLKKTVESFSNYLAFLDETELHCSNCADSATIPHFQKMKYVYLLLQSEFLRRLSLCFIPSLWTCDLRVLIPGIFELIDNVNKECSNLYTMLKSIFEMFYTYEKSEHNEIQAIKLDTKWIYREAYVKLSSVSFNMQSALRESRCLEEYIENTRFEDADYETMIKLLDTKSEEIVKNYNRCSAVVNDFRKYVLSLKPKEAGPDIHSVPAPEVNADVTKTNILLGVTDFSPNWPDEVYVGVSEAKMNETEVMDSVDDESNPCSKLLINELKIALQGKAKERKERERVALKNKNIDDINDIQEPETDETTPNDSGDDEISSVCQEKDSKPCTNVEESKFKPQINSETPFAQQIASASASWGLQTEEYCAESESSE